MGEAGFETLRGGQADLLGDGPNLYTYVKNDPIDRIDPLGLRLTMQDCQDFRVDCIRGVSEAFGMAGKKGAGQGAVSAGVGMAIGKKYGSAVGKTVGGVGGVATLYGLGKSMCEANDLRKQCKQLYDRCVESVLDSESSR